MPKNEDLKELQELIGKTYLMADPYLVKLMVAAAITQFLPGDPVWTIIVGPSGGGKSEFVNMLYRVNWMPDGKDPQKVWPISAMTANTLVSGARGGKGEASLICRIKSGIISMKDFTSLLAEKPEVRSVIVGQLREIYDGKYDKGFGTGESVNWRGKITVIAGATYSVHSMRQAYTAMGERFTFYHIIMPDRMEAARWTMRNQEAGNMDERREEIAVAVEKLVKNIMTALPANLPKLDESLRDNLLFLSELATRSRSSIERDWRSPKKEILEANPAEMPTRFAGGLQQYAQAFRTINYYTYGEFILLPEDYDTLNKMALDSVTNMRRKAMTQLAQYTSATTAAIATALNLPTSTLQLHLQDLNALGIVDRAKAFKGNADNWILKEEYRQLLIKFDKISPVNEEAPELEEPEIDKSLYEGEPKAEEINEVNAQLDIGGGIK